MDIQDLRKELEESDDKWSIISDVNKLSQYSVNISQLISLINDFFNDEEKEQLFEIDYFKKTKPMVRKGVIKGIVQDKIKWSLMKDKEATEGFQKWDIEEVIYSLGDNGKVELLHDSEFLKKYGIKQSTIVKIVESLSEPMKKQILEDVNFVQKELNLQTYQVVTLVSAVQEEQFKTDIMGMYEFKRYEQMNIWKSFSDKSKSEMILGDEQNFRKNEFAELISSLSVEALADFIKNNKDFFIQQNISIYEITRKFDVEKQLEFFTKFEDMGLSLVEKRQVLATLQQKVKEKIELSGIKPEYVTAAEITKFDGHNSRSSRGAIVVDFSKDLEIYRGLDKLISINPIHLESEEKEKFDILCEICPQMTVLNDLEIGESTVQEYKDAEKWIETVLLGINPEWSEIQKVAYVDNAIGKKISYSPDFDTEVSDQNAARALWKIISTGYGVCNGIAEVEKYILDKIGIESELASSGKHTFLKLKDIELPNADGSIAVGDTLLDPTWNLSAQRYGARPNLFCVSYEQIRKNDIREDGTDACSHKNDKLLSGVTLGLDDINLRRIYASIGIVREDGTFPIQDLLTKAKAIDDKRYSSDVSIQKQLELLKEYYPNFASCPNSTMTILKGVSLAQPNLSFQKCVVNRVYKKNDESKTPVLYIYADLPESGKKFYYADRESGEFVEVPEKQFEERFDCFDMDIQKNKGQKPWSTSKENVVQEDLNRSSGKITVEGEVR